VVCMYAFLEKSSRFGDKSVDCIAAWRYDMIWILHVNRVMVSVSTNIFNTIKF
jgi:hypothetical protein